MKTTFFLAVFLLWLPGFTPVAQKQKAVSGPLKAWKLAFVRSGDIWIANGNGSGQRLLIKNGQSPCWSPDRKRIAFARNNNVWIANADGSGQRQLTFRWKDNRPEPNGADRFDGGCDIAIAWDPRDDMITFSHWEQFRVTRVGNRKSRIIAGCSIYDVPAKNPKAGELTVRFDLYDDEARFHPSVNAYPAWSRSGQYLAFMRNGDIWIAERGNLRCPELRRLRSWSDWEWDVTRLDATASYDAPTWRGSRENNFVTCLSWSPDEKYLAYGQQRINGSGMRGIYLLRITKTKGSSPQAKHARWLAGGFHPCYSPDGKWVVYESSYEGSAERGVWTWGILAQSVDGKTIKPLIADGTQPAW